MPDAETAIRAFNGLRRHLPLLAALGANSPFRHGRDTGLASAREMTMRAWPRTGIHRALRGASIDAKAVVVLPQPEWSRSPAASPYGTPESLRTRIEHFNAIIEEEAERAGSPYIDLYPLMHRQAAAEMLATDELHPNTEAHAEWATELAVRVRLAAPAVATPAR